MRIRHSKDLCGSGTVKAWIAALFVLSACACGQGRIDPGLPPVPLHNTPALLLPGVDTAKEPNAVLSPLNAGQKYSIFSQPSFDPYLKFTSISQAVPEPSAVEFPGALAFQPQSSATLAGTVRDAHGAVIPGIPVMLSGQDHAVNRAVTADNKGAFMFSGLPAGTYVLKINVAGLVPFVSSAVVLGAGETRQLPIVITHIPSQKTTVTVTATPGEVAQAQVQQQEKQRVLGVLPDYYTSYIWAAAPMTPALKFRLALRSAVDPVTILVTAGLAGIEQYHNTFPGYGRGWEGYGKRFGGAYADTMSTRLISRALLPTILHQDPRYFYRGSGSIRSRIFYALAASFVTRSDSGRLEPNYSQLLGNFAAAGLSNVYRAPGDRSVGLTLRNGLVITATGAVENLLREFLSRKLTPNVPAFAKGKS